MSNHEYIRDLEADRDNARRESDIQLGQKLAAQMTLKAVCDALDLPMVSLGNGWTEATPKILARIETIVDEANRGFRERDQAWVGSQIALCEEFIRAAENDETFGVEDVEAKLILLTGRET